MVFGYLILFVFGLCLCFAVCLCLVLVCILGVGLVRWVCVIVICWWFVSLGGVFI